MSLLVKLKLGILICILALFAQSFAQEKPEVIKKVNFGYSKNPPARTQKNPKEKKSGSEKKSKKTEKNSKQVAKSKTSKEPGKNGKLESGETPGSTVVGKSGNGKAKIEPATTDAALISAEETGEMATIAKKTREIAKKASNDSLPLTEVYKVGIDDVLFISLQNKGSGTSRYYTVLNDGTIDYPLAGELVSVVGLTTDEIEDLLRSKVKLYENPEITVKVREYASHKIMVLGLVEKSGEKYLRREAMPLYVIRAEAIVKPDATQVVLRKTGAEEATYELDDSKTGEILIQTGDIVEFIKGQAANSAIKVTGFYYIGEMVRKFGRKDFYEGLTLTQAILESGGLRNSRTKKVIIRRKNEKGLLESETYKLREIKNGKIPDPLLMVGDTIESAN
ncbi:MAG: hypothetical protein HKN25_11795 [Pyrinomonadaceae bacterium]|nr:hypothetical protein [Pyrinomonadaceae bacterium]